MKNVWTQARAIKHALEELEIDNLAYQHFRNNFLQAIKKELNCLINLKKSLRITIEEIEQAVKIMESDTSTTAN